MKLISHKVDENNFSWLISLSSCWPYMESCDYQQCTCPVLWVYSSIISYKYGLYVAVGRGPLKSTLIPCIGPEAFIKIPSVGWLNQCFTSAQILQSSVEKERFLEPDIGMMVRVFTNGPRRPGHTKDSNLMPPCLTLSIIR